MGAAEAQSEHPLAQAIVEYATAICGSLPVAESFKVASGKGLSCVVEGETVLVGNRRWMSEHGLSTTETIESAMSKLETAGKTAVLVAAGGIILGTVGVADQLKVDS